MKAAVFKQANKPLVIEGRPLPELAPNQLLVKVKAVGICGSDLHASETDRIPTDIVMGHEFAGEVVDMGKAVTDWSVGDRAVPMVNVVCGECASCYRQDYSNCENLDEIGYSKTSSGAYAEYIAVSAPTALRLPDNLDYSDAAVVEPLAVGYDAVRRAELRMDDAVLVIGAGPIGLSIVQWCKHFGVTHTAVSELNSNRLKRAKDMGATLLIDGNSVTDPVAEFTRISGRPPSVIVEAVGVPGMIQRCIAMAPKDTRIVVVGVCMHSDRFEPMECIMKRLSLIFTMGYRLEDFATILELMSQGRIIGKPLISHRISLDELPDMFERMRKPTDQIKVIVEP